MPSSAAAANHPAVAGHGGRGASAVNAAAAAAAMSSDISRRNPQEDYELLQVRNHQFFYYRLIKILSMYFRILKLEIRDLAHFYFAILKFSY